MTFGTMFHHFHDAQVHQASQGSISAEQFAVLLEWLDEQYNMVSAPDYIEGCEAGTLTGRDICVTFDDALLCQRDVALPVLDRFGIKAFFFIYSSVFTDTPDRLEIYRDFRNFSFADIEDFYARFFARFERSMPPLHRRYLAGYPVGYLSEFPFYTENDRRFRFVRDHLLHDGGYDRLMEEMMADADYPLEVRRARLWMDASHVAGLAAAGHVVGLHSHTHPTQMERLDREQQAAEYTTNHRVLSEVCGIAPRTMSHPCGSYGLATLDILRSLGIVLGFRSSLSVGPHGSPLEIPREDHANLMRQAG